MAADVVLVSRFPLAQGAAEILRTGLKDEPHLRYLFDFEQQELLQLRAYDSVTAFAADAAQLAAELQRFAPHMVADVRRELLTYVEAPKPCGSPLPQTDYLQLRHVEVPPPRIPAYRSWREETIFQVVRESAPVEVFLAYHSLVSGQPGVMFISGFSGAPQEYRAVFESERYREIVRQAGDGYITGGADGLYTRFYARPGLRGA
ncbi:hypothetical protein OOT46_15770 [Aquabacterium sp. A7-Y]|uniref:hypothetical protein n=1 Tax=Aquabacterium sp. A7-Y TaxID=1349605 RepID=UPI00223D7F16|nr:hypothetical protein [Aquabacterium sp. A7-Y]MCW7539302.1 hypothetical protein [Aquabacterium sp. A7-Y]